MESNTVAATNQADQQKIPYRIESIDILRGLVMILMALDHTRDYFHLGAWTSDPLDLSTTSPVLFFTRWITHYCAPVFVFLAGASAWFQSRKKPKPELSSFLIKRGFWLILIEIVVFNFAFTFDPSYSIVALQVIWAIGVSMIVLGLLVRLPFAVIAIIGVALVIFHNALDFYEINHDGPFSITYSLLHRPGMFPLSENHSLFAFYPVVPWVGLMVLGYCFGKFYSSFEGKQRAKIISRLGFGIILLFIALRFTNIYGDPKPWSEQKNLLYTIFSFVDTQKYPPSLLYMCMTIGPAIIFLTLFERTRNAFTKIIVVYGRVPFFYYILHFFLIHFLCMVFFMARGHSFSEGIHKKPGMLPNFVVANEGYSLLTVYAFWILVLLILFPLCKWFSNYKKTHNNWWLSYL